MKNHCIGQVYSNVPISSLLAGSIVIWYDWTSACLERVSVPKNSDNIK